MSVEEFANSVAQTGILSQQETIDLFLHFTASTKPHLRYPIKARQGLKTQVRFTEIFKVFIKLRKLHKEQVLIVLIFILARFVTDFCRVRIDRISGVTEADATRSNSALTSEYSSLVSVYTGVHRVQRITMSESNWKDWVACCRKIILNFFPMARAIPFTFISKVRYV